MDKQFLEDMIEDLEQAKRLIERRLRVLRAMAGGTAPSENPSQAMSLKSDLKAEIERQRLEIMAQVSQIKTQATQVANTARASIAGAGLPMAGMADFGQGSAGPMEELRRKVAAKASAAGELATVSKENGK